MSHLPWLEMGIFHDLYYVSNCQSKQWKVKCTTYKKVAYSNNLLEWISKHKCGKLSHIPFYKPGLKHVLLCASSPYLITLQCLSYNCRGHCIFACCLFVRKRSWNRTGITILPTHSRHNLRIRVSQLSNMKQSLPFLLRRLSHPLLDKNSYLNCTRSSLPDSWLRSWTASASHFWHEFGNDFWWQDEVCERAAWPEVMS